MQTEPIEKSEIDLMVDWLEEAEEIPCEGDMSDDSECPDPAKHRMTALPCGCQSNLCDGHLFITLVMFANARRPTCVLCATRSTDVKHHPI